jgi:raffinose/stachyose/melibiose transport system permease protein
MSRTLRNPLIYILYLAPTFILLSVFFYLPLIEAFFLGFTKWNGINPPVFNGLDNFKEILQDQNFLKAFKNNMVVILFSCFISLPLYFFIAILISNVTKFASMYKIIFFIPVILSTAIIGIIWGVVLEPNIGILNNFLRFIGLDQFAMFWIADPKTAMISVLVVNLWQWAGFNIILFLTGIYGIPKEMKEASAIDGANSFQYTTQIVIPLLKPVIAVVFILAVIGSMKVLDIVYVLTGGGPFGSTDVMATYMIEQAYGRQKYGYANMIAIIIFIITVTFASISNLISKKWVDKE